VSVRKVSAQYRMVKSLFCTIKYPTEEYPMLNVKR